MTVTNNHIIPMIAGAFAALAVAVAPAAAAQTFAQDSTVTQTNGNAQVVATPGASADHAAQMQQPFGGNMGALLFHH